MAANPLSGIRVLDMTQYLAGPYCTMLLSDLGAEVVKVERPPHGEDGRYIGEVKIGDGISALWTAINRNKKSIAIDLKADEGRETLARLIDAADVLVENFRPGVMERLGLDWDTLHARNPQLVYCKISGYGADGPSAHLGGFDLILQAEAGLISANGTPGSPPASLPLHLLDSGTGVFSALGVMTALFERERSGVGQRVDASLFNTAMAWAIGHITSYYLEGVVPEPSGTVDRTGAPSQAFEAADGWFVLGAFTDDLFRGCCKALDLVELVEDPRYVSRGSRLKNHEELARAISAAVKTRSRAECVQRLSAEGVPAAPVNTLAEALEHPQAQHNGVAVPQQHPSGIELKLPVTPLKFSRSEIGVHSPAPGVGEHTDEIIRAWTTREPDVTPRVAEETSRG